MTDSSWKKGQRVTWTNKDGVTLNGVVDQSRRGWVLVHLDESFETPGGWAASKMMLKATDIQDLP